MARKLPSFQVLQCFEAAARQESYTRAARELALTQGAVSRRIASLEAFLGFDLFRRTRHGVRLTEEGAAYARRIAGRLDGLERDTLDAMARQGAGGSIRLASVPTFATRWLLPRLPWFSALHPDITIHLETRTRPFLFAETSHDAALYAGTAEQIAQWPGIRATALMREDVVPMASPALLATRASWTPADIAAAPLLQQSTRPEAWRQWFAAMEVDSPMALAGPRYDLFSMAAVAATAGLGIALVPKMLVMAELARGELVIACDRPLHGASHYYLVIPETAAGNARLRHFSEWLQQAAAANHAVDQAPLSFATRGASRSPASGQ
ncbi:LysR family transcriptional regulator [Pseudoxanthomonas yeongjuensis]|uniref:LysR substrate-binding domain-containing protein n=1 Tax=Pseudoxanthomonas yeongjuensis TaxID=377616 RepID=UPI0013917421|nr:LysR substrate-binding domain-containing protein [Pseudoxanthomonas yeongjuensis]KAF1714615.1 LysR family transcriptional regulator [Pseudoxanthomonas yeongjuensis]